MGYRLTFTTDDIRMSLPEWFHDKWHTLVHLPMPMSSKDERRLCVWLELMEDTQKAFKEIEYHYRVYFIIMGEDGKLYQYRVDKERVENLLSTD